MSTIAFGTEGGFAGLRALERMGLNLAGVPGKCHPRADEAQEMTRIWADAYGLIGDDDQQRRFEQLGYSKLLSYGCTTASLEDLALYAQWFTYYFLLDDQQDLAVLTGRHEQFVALQEELRRVFHAGAVSGPSRPSTGLVAAVADLCCRTVPQVSLGWWYRYIGHAEHVFAAQRLESMYRLAGSVPPVEEFMEIRRRASAVDMVFDIIEACERIELPEPLRYSLAFRQYADDLNDFTTWSNDILGVEHDAANTDPNNYVLVLERSAGLSRHQALETVATKTAVLLQRIAERAGDVRVLAQAYGAPTCERVERALDAWYAWSVNVPLHYLQAHGRLTQMDQAAPGQPPAFAADLLLARADRLNGLR